MALAHAAADPAFLETVRRVRQNVLSFQLGLLHRDAVLTVAGKHELRAALPAACGASASWSPAGRRRTPRRC